jgi:hypothetical protein
MSKTLPARTDAEPLCGGVRVERGLPRGMPPPTRGELGPRTAA